MKKIYRRNWTRRDFIRLSAVVAAGFSLGTLKPGWGVPASLAAGPLPISEIDQITPESVDPVLSAMMDKEIRVPNTSPVRNGQPNLHASDLEITPLTQTKSILGHAITSTRDPLQDLELALYRLQSAAKSAGDEPLSELGSAQEVMDILLGNTQGRVYDGFALLNFNRGAITPDHISGEYKMKRLKDSRETIISQIDGESHKIWEVTINMFWHGQNFDSDTFLLRVPYEAHAYDEFRINWRIYSLIQEDLAPTTILNDGFGRIFHGLDSTFTSMEVDSLNEITVKYPSLIHFKGIYNWGWGSHPPRVRFLQPVVEANENGDLNPVGLSFATRNREDLTIENIGEFGPYDIVLAYLNNEIYGDNPYVQFGAEGKGGVLRDFEQSGLMRVKVINLDNHVHYYRNVDFGAQFIHEIKETFGNGKFSFEKFNAKPTYGVPKVAEMQWRTGWGFVPHLGIAAQAGVFPRDVDREHLSKFTDQLGQEHWGYLFKHVNGYWRFNPPAPIRAGPGLEAGDPLRDADGQDGVLIGFDTEGFGVAKMPKDKITKHPDQDNFPELQYPDFLRNPKSGGDIIPPTPKWSPFLTLNPDTGTLKGPNGRYWVDYTYFHGRPVPGNNSIVAEIEAPRAGAQLFYQFDPLCHDNMIFSYHPRSDIARG